MRWLRRLCINRCRRRLDSELQFHVSSKPPNIRGRAPPRRSAAAALPSEFVELRASRKNAAKHGGKIAWDTLARDFQFCFSRLLKIAASPALAISRWSRHRRVHRPSSAIVDNALFRAFPYKIPTSCRHARPRQGQCDREWPALSSILNSRST